MSITIQLLESPGFGTSFKTKIWVGNQQIWTGPGPVRTLSKKENSSVTYVVSDTLFGYCEKYPVVNYRIG